MRKLKALLIASVLLVGAAACGDDDDDAADVGAPEDAPAAEATEIDVVATEYAFEIPSTITGGLVQMNYSNEGQEPHFAAFAKAAPGKTFDDVKAALSAPPSGGAPSGPPPFEEVAGAPTADPGGTGTLTFNLPAGTYALFCAIPAPDGVPHVAKGMIAEVTVTEGAEGELPEAVGTVIAEDFSLIGTPELEAGTSTVKVRNDGNQLHEINLIELAPDATIDDVVTWAKGPAGPPPHKSLSGVAVAPGQEGTAEFEFKAGSTYAFICMIPDVLGDFAPHITKGMFTPAFTT